MRRIPVKILPVLLCAWLCATAAGLRALWAYSVTPGASAPAAQEWPAKSSLARSADRPTLVMFVHPKCPCSRASIQQLAGIVAHCRDRLAVQVIAIKPTAISAEWERTPLLQNAREIPGVHLMIDEGGGEADLFGAKTSGDSRLYDAKGRLLFAGGITAARGHEGDNAGADAIINFVNRTASDTHQTSVFGCPLASTSSSCETGAQACPR